MAPFLSFAQKEAVRDLSDGEEHHFFLEKMQELQKTVEDMPKTYEQDGMGLNAIASLHYFSGGSDWYILEKDQEEEQLQAYGFAVLNGDIYNAECGYISIKELLRHNNVELDFHFKPITLGEIKAALAKAEQEEENAHGAGMQAG